MQATASAPGKLLLLGEYAVLHGAPALVIAVDRRAQATVAGSPFAAPAHGVRVDAPTLGIWGASAEVLATGSIRWSAEADADRLAMVSELLRMGVTRCSEPGYHLTLDTDAFFVARGKQKYGIGSSSASTVALAGALAAATDQPTPGLQSLVEVHRDIQGGRGSGVDIAAALYGGSLLCRSHETGVEAAAVDLPVDLRWCCVWTGRPASTASLLRTVGQWAARRPVEHARAMESLSEVAEVGASALHQGDAEQVIDALQTYARVLVRMGSHSGADILSAEHRQIASAAGASGVVYKTCGAGGGDVGAAVSSDADRLRDFRARVHGAGFRTIDLAVDPRGLTVHTSDE